MGLACFWRQCILATPFNILLAAYQQSISSISSLSIVDMMIV